MTESNFETVYSDYCKISDIVLRFASMYPEESNAGDGSVPGLVQLMLDKIIELENKNDV